MRLGGVHARRGFVVVVRLRYLGPLAGVIALMAACSSASIPAAAGSPTPAAGPDSPPPRSATTPSVIVRPNRDLHPGQQVTVVVDGFSAQRKVFFSECLNRTAATSFGCGQQLAGQLFTITDARGHATVRFTVTASAASSYRSSPRKCQGHCVLVATGGYRSAFATAPLRLSAT